MLDSTAVTARLGCTTVARLTMAIKSDQASTVGSTTTITGNVVGRGDLRIQGNIKGSVRVEGRIEVSSDANVEGPIEGTSLVLQGNAKGDIVVAGTVSFGPHSSYSGVVRAANVTIAPGAEVSAELDTGFDLHLNI